MVAPTISCPSCNYDLSQTRAPRCPECGAAFDRDLLLQPKSREMSGARLAFLLLCTVGWIPAAMTVAWALGSFNWHFLRAALFPYSALIEPLAPFAAVPAIGLAAVQWPFYGVVLGVHWPPRKYGRTWLGLSGVHAASTLAAWLCSL